MLKSLLSPIYRMLKKNRLDFFINLIGLSAAMLVFIFVSLYVKNETSFDAYHPDADRIYRLTTSITSPNGQNTDMALANTAFGYILKNNCPEVENIACVDIGDNAKLKYGEKEFENINVRAATPSIFKLFSYPSVEGKPDDFLVSPHTIILTQSLARKIFKQEDPMGKQITIGKDNYEVNGVIKDLPANTDLTFAALIPSNVNGTEDLVDWGDYFVYLEINTTDINRLRSQVDTLTTKTYTELLKKMGGFHLKHHLQPLKSIHFDNTLLADTPKGNKTMVYVFSIIAILILVIAGINYINITIAQLQKRQKEFSIRKIIGCDRKWIIYYVLTESILTAMVAAFLSILLAAILLSQFNALFGERFSLHAIFQLSVPLLLVFFGFGLLAGLYPAFKSLKPGFDTETGFSLFGKSLVAFQNIISIVMIAGVILIWSQIHFMKNSNLGFDKEQLIAVSLSDHENLPGKEVLQNEFQKLPEVKSFAFGGGGTNLGNTNHWMKAIMVTKDEEGNDLQFVLNEPSVDENYIRLFGLQLLKGRNFSPTMPSDSDHAVIINEAYVRKMGWKNPIGKYVFENQKQKIIGVVKDFHFEALNNPIEPLMFRMLKGQPDYMFLRVEPRYLDLIRKQWKKIANGVPFEFSFMDRHMNQLYEKNEHQMTIFSYLTIIALVISCLGLYGLASHFITNRTKEIGIRKVNGAKVSEVMTLLNKDFIKWVVIAFVIAAPIAWFAMNKWLENFAYKTDLSWWIFALAGMLAIGIALLTVSWQSWKAATRNPVEALRYE
ncbi:ABC transporter permease [Prolixibacter bellariivorans]|uniref:ABC transporter permease n=1 Tax=Prolixibacter bellariivorans TaxID=314319 RepID=A0A5M4B387_9BACT|nr:ABC transporter permease [Prolixibacter bellariivorans]GET34137.1 ABC transporter permease [Prolixibacter bellariivorans]